MTDNDRSTWTDADWTAHARSLYTDVSRTVARLTRCKNARETLGVAGSMLATARRPGFRFGLNPEDIPAEVHAVLERAVAESAALLRPFAKRMLELRAQGFASDEMWNHLDREGAGELGLKYGDSLLLEGLAT